MKRKFLQLTSAAALLLAVSIAGCSRESEKIDDGGDRVVYLKVAETTTRAETTSAVNTKTDLTDGYIIFTTASGVINRYLTIAGVEDDDAVGENGAEVSVDQLTRAAGVVIEGVPGSSTMVYLVGNLPEEDPVVAPEEGANVTSYLAERVITVSDLYATDGGIANVTLLGKGDILPVTGEDDYEFTAAVELVPVAGRLEISKITGPAEITSFKVKGIFVNDYYSEFGSNGTVDEDNRVKNLTGTAFSAGTDGSYTGLSGILYNAYGEPDNVNEGLASSAGVAVPTDSKPVWAYNLPAPALATGKHYFPHVVIVLTNIVLEDDVEAGEDYGDGLRYLTLTNVYDGDETPNPGTEDYLDFAGGTVYQIEDLAFQLGQLSRVPEPDETSKKVLVTVTTRSWAGKKVQPVL